MQKLNDLMQIPLLVEGEEMFLEITCEGKSKLRIITEAEANSYAESIYQLFEGNSYEYKLVGTNAKYFGIKARVEGVVLASNRYPYRGRIVPNIYVGSLSLDIVNSKNECVLTTVSLEVLATKFDMDEDKSYRKNYRQMLEDITDKCTDLMLQINNAVNQNVQIDYTEDSKTLYQRFCFVRSFLDGPDFEESIIQIISNPSTKWDNNENTIKSSQIRRVNRSVVKQLISGSSRIDTSSIDYLNSVGLSSISSHIQTTIRVESLDTAENRFIKHVLQVFLNFVENCLDNFRQNSIYSFAVLEAKELVEKLNSYLSYSFFDQISPATTLKLNSPLLQKRSGYREVLNRWLQFDLASKLVWEGADDVYDVGKRDIAVLYEYWLFFELYDLIKEKFGLEHYSSSNLYHLFESQDNDVLLKLKSGKELVITGETDFITRKLCMRFSYNRTFNGGNKYNLGKAGSITTTLRPDYTLSVWPSSFSETEAEKQDVMVHIHFDAKYKIDISKIQYKDFEDDKEIDQRKLEERKGTFKNIDLLKMHAYKDAIRRTAGAYILYPGSEDKLYTGFHEVLPGVGAFSITPSVYDTGIANLGVFLDQVIKQLINRTSHRERIAMSTASILEEEIIDYTSDFRSLNKELEREKIDVVNTSVLVGNVLNQQDLQWCLENNLYKFRTSDSKGNLLILPEIINAKYLLIKHKGEKNTSLLFKIKDTGFRVLSKEQLIKKGCVNLDKFDYLVIDIEPCNYWDDFYFNVNNLDIDLESKQVEVVPFYCLLRQ
ncbi:DUF2357 domain-containing protein [Myroides pelagicus]|uniref:DUF2357 domain-containing protein n=1 Tax=Myroides pelagicus TaxID=270914 RepID=A0A7K1GPP8_9FLAO|nr:DUF2357 domain-containing protein [Myroides pelagicus]MTH30821.1 DUF2357 domain-containing protein [Myroides pelagicus]